MTPMEPFRLTRQAAAFLALICAVAVIVAVAAPFGSIALGAAAVLTLGVVMIKALLRGRNWRPLSAVEGTLALSSLVLVVGGVAVFGYSIVRLGNEHALEMMIGWPRVHRDRPMKSTTHAVNYSDPDQQRRLKDALREAGIPFTLEMREGQEYIGWTDEHHAAVEAIDARVKQSGLQPGRSAHFSEPAAQKRFMDWLEKNGIKHEVIKVRGEDYVVWDGPQEVVREYMAERARECKDRIAAGKPGARSC